MTTPVTFHEFLPGQDLTADRLNSPHRVTRWAVQLAEQQNATTTYEASNDLIVPVEANTSWFFEACIFYTSSTTAEFQMRFTLPDPDDFIRKVWMMRPLGSAAEQTTLSTRVDDDDELWGSAAGTSAMRAALPRGIISVGETAGDVGVEFRQRNADADPASLRAGSMIRLTRYL